MKRFLGLFGVIAVLAALAASTVTAQSPTAYRRVTGNSLALTGTPAAVVTAVAGKALRVKAVYVGAGTDGTIQFYNGSGTGSPIGFPIRVESTVSITKLTEAELGSGFATSVGTALYASGDQTFSIGLVVQEE